VRRYTWECESANEVSAGFGGMAEQTTELITRLKLVGPARYCPPLDFLFVTFIEPQATHMVRLNQPLRHVKRTVLTPVRV
jgi:hypothetical protein